MESSAIKAKVLLFKTPFCCTHYYWTGETVQHQKLSLESGDRSDSSNGQPVFHLGYVVLGALPVFPALATKDPLRRNILLNEMIRSSFFCELHQSDILCVSYAYVPLVSNTERRRKDILYIDTLEMLTSLFCSTGLSI